MRSVDDIKLYPHNQETYDKIQEAWKTSNKVAAVQATGTGKTYLILKCLYNKINENKVVLAPSTYILEQLEHEAGEMIPNTQLITYSKLAYMTDKEIISLDPSLIVLDEFHRCGAEQWGSGVQKLLNNFSNAKVLGTSANNIRFLDDNRDMAEELFGGNVVNNLSLAEAIVKKILPMPKYVSALYTFDDEVTNLKDKVNKSKNSDEEKEDLLKEIDKMKNKLDKSKGIPQILKKHLDKNNNDKFIVFCKDGQHLNEMKEVVVDWVKKAKITKKVEVYSAYTEYENTDKEFNQFCNNKAEDTIKLLFSIDMLNEGIHIKDVSGVILLRPTISPIIYYQQIGRAIQVGKNENPLIFDFVNNFDNIGAKNFINDLQEYSRIEREKSRVDEENIKIDNAFDFMIFDEIQEAKILFEQLEEKLIDNWNAMYNKLIEYKKENRNCDVSRSYVNKFLYNWVLNQRQIYRKNKLSCEKIKKLNDLGFSWNIMIEWDIMYDELKKYIKKHGSCDILRTNENKMLITWIGTQRTMHRKNKLNEERVKKLEDIGFVWNLEDKKWNEKYEKLKQYQNEYGNCEVINNCKDKSLYNWTSTQRTYYNNGKLSEEKVLKLNDLNFNWSPVKEWDDMYKFLVEFKNKFGHCNIKRSYEDKKLASWVNRQRQFYKKNKLSKDKIKKLEEIGFLWEVSVNVSGIVGISWDATHASWISKIRVDKKDIFLGSRKNKKDAIKVRRDAELKYFGKSDIKLEDFKEEKSTEKV